MSNFISNLSKRYDIQIPFSKEPEKGQNSYSLDGEGNITSLYLNDVDIKSLEVLLPISDQLEELSVKNCSINQVQSPNAFANLKKLILVEESFKQMALNNLVQLQSLIELDLNLTEIKDSSPLSELTNLRRLDLSFSVELEKINGLEKLNFLEHLEVQYSSIDDLGNVAINENIQSINFKGNSISKISNLERYPNLAELVLSSNSIKKIEGLNPLKKLNRLNLCFNNIEKIDGLNDLINLEILDLSGQEIKKIEGLDQLINLKELNLLMNNITKVENLNNLKNLEYLLFDMNSISEFDTTFLNNLKSPCYISLIGNPITHLDTTLPDTITVDYKTDHWVRRVI